jgi:hypothetical protein
MDGAGTSGWDYLPAYDCYVWEVLTDTHCDPCKPLSPSTGYAVVQPQRKCPYPSTSLADALPLLDNMVGCPWGEINK